MNRTPTDEPSEKKPTMGLSTDEAGNHSDTQQGVVMAIEQDWTPEEERRVVRKLDCFLLPLLVFGFFALQLDRANIANALTGTITEDLGVTRREINTGNQLQMVAIVIAEIPANLALQKVGTSLWLFCQCVCWGLVGMFQAFITNKKSYYATRFLLGLFEAGYIPGSMLVMSLFYKRDEIALRTAVFYFGNYFSAGTGSLIAAGLLQMHGARGLSGWQWLFLIDGSVTIVVAILFFLLLPASPVRTLPLCCIPKLDLFSARDRHVMHRRVVLDDPSKSSSTLSSGLGVRTVLTTLLDHRLWGHMVINIVGLAPKGGLALYSPTVIKALGFSTTKANALSSVSNYGVCVLSFVFSWASDARKQRGLWCVVACAWPMAFAGALLGLPLGADQWARYAVFTLLNCANGIVQTLNDAWCSSNARSHRHRSVGLAMAVMGSNLGGIAGQQLFQDNDAPRYRSAFTAVLCLYAGAMLLIVGQMGVFAWENRNKGRLTEGLEGGEGGDEVQNAAVRRYEL